MTETDQTGQPRTRMRVVAWVVQPVVMADDGENLREVPIKPVRIPAAEWQAFKDGGDEIGLAQAREQIEGAAGS